MTDIPSYTTPNCPNFSSGPTRKHPGWGLETLETSTLGRSHRSPLGLAHLQNMLNLTRQVLKIPDNYRIGLVPGSATGAIECALWSLLGPRPVDVFVWDVFSSLWLKNVVQELKVQNTHAFTAPFGALPNLYEHDNQHDVVFAWNGTTAGVCAPDAKWISDNRLGLSICDATSAAFCVPLDWEKLDATAFSWQKGIGGEAAHGMLVLSPRAIKRLQNYTPSWPMPRLFNLIKEGQLLEGVFQGKTLNTPSMLCVEDCLSALKWAQNLGGISALSARCYQNFEVIQQWLEVSPWCENLAPNPLIQSPISPCFKLKETFFKADDHLAIISTVCQKLADLKVAHDIKNHALAPPSFRIWCGPTIEKADIIALLPWIDWALEEAYKQSSI